MFVIVYYNGKNPTRFDYNFDSLWAAQNIACRIFENYGYTVEIMNRKTGEIVDRYGLQGAKW